MIEMRKICFCFWWRRLCINGQRIKNSNSRHFLCRRSII